MNDLSQKAVYQCSGKLDYMVAAQAVHHHPIKCFVADWSY